MPWRNHTPGEPVPEVTPVFRGSPLGGRGSPGHGKTPREFRPKPRPSRGSPSRSVPFGLTEMPVSTEVSTGFDPSLPVGPDRWGPSPDFPFGAVTFPFGTATLPDPVTPFGVPAPSTWFPASTTKKQSRRD